MRGIQMLCIVMAQNRRITVVLLIWIGWTILSLGCSKPDLGPQDEANQLCAWHPQGLPETPFSTDACSAWPDGDWGECCVEHDLSYWCGGTSAQRSEADERLRACVGEEHSAALARTMSPSPSRKTERSASGTNIV